MRIRIIYNSVLKTVSLINAQTENEISYNSTNYLGKYSPDSGNKVTLLNLEKLVMDIYKNYGDENIVITSYSSENAKNIIENAIKNLNDNRITFDNNNSRLVFNEADVVYNDLRNYCDELYSVTNELLTNDESKRAEIIKTTLKDTFDLRSVLNEADVIICVTGAYSTGKSTFINALFGKRLLPRSMNKETAKLCKIKKGPSLKISFTLDDNSVIEMFDFEVDKYKLRGNSEHPIVRFIMDELVNEQKNIKVVEDNVYYILAAINKFYNTQNYCNAILGIIDLIVPYDLLGGLSYIVYDTPGAGSTCVRDDIELRKIINSPLKPITIFLNSGDKIEEMPVSDLLSLIKLNGNLEYTMYVINKADAILDGKPSDLKTQIELFKNNDNNSREEDEIVDMRDNQLFFVSSHGALAGEALKDDLNPQSVVDRNIDSLIEQVNGSTGKYYKYLSINGLSSVRTAQMINLCEEELENAKYERKNNVVEGRTLLVNSGMFALKKALEFSAKDNLLTIKTENLYLEYRKIIDLLDEYFHQIISSLQISGEQKKKDVSILENTIMNQLDDIKNGMVSYVQLSLKNDYQAADTDFKKMYDKDTKIFAVVDKIKINSELKKTIKKPATSLKDIYFKLLYNYKNFDKYVQFNIFERTEKQVKDKTYKKVHAIEAMIKQLDADYWTIRKQELRKYVKKLLTNIKNSIDLMIDLSEETKKAIQIIPNHEPDDNFNLPEFDFEQFKEKRIKQKVVKKELEEWIKESLEFRRVVYEREFVHTVEKVMTQICITLKENIKNISDDLSKQLAEGINIQEEIIVINEKLQRVAILSKQLEEIVGNNII